MRVFVLLALLMLAACGRPLSENERAFLAVTHGPGLNPDAVRLHEGLALGSGVLVPPRPRLTCRDRLFPPRSEARRLHPGAMAIFRDIYLRDDLWSRDYLSEWPARMDLADAMLLAHEMTHVWQWQNRAVTGYHPLKAAFEHVGSRDPYQFGAEATGDFLDYGYEQQGAIVEEWLCCATLAPEAARTDRLAALLAPHFPTDRLRAALPGEIWLPWSGVEIAGICD